MKNKLKINAAITTIAVVVCVILLNMVVGAINDKLPIEVDFTKEKVYDFSDQTKSVMKELDKDVEVYALIPDNVTDDYLAYVKEYLAKYEAMSDRYSVKYIDPYTEPAFLSKYSTDGDAIDLGSIIVTCGEKFRVISYNSLFKTNANNSSISIDMETKMTSAVIYVTGHGEEVKIYFTTGHEEIECPNFTSYLTGEGYSCSEINLSKTDIPGDAAIVVIASPGNDFTLEEIKKIDKFSDGGGQIIVTAPLPGVTTPQNIAGYLGDWGIEFGNDQVVETDPSRMINTTNGAAPAPVILDHKITEKIINQKLEYVSPESTSIITHVNNIYGAVHAPLLRTSDAAESISYNSSETKKGPFDLMVLATKLVDNGKSNLLAVGSLVSIEAPVIIGQSTYANSDLILNAVASVTDSTSSLDIRAKKVSSDYMRMTETQVRLTQIILLYILPVVIFIAGIVIWFRRRYL